MFVKGQSGNPNGRKKGSKNKETIAKEERRAIFDNEVSQMYLDTIRKARPEYLLDQFIGAATQKHEHSGEIKTTTLPPEVIAAIEEDLKKKKIE